MKNRESAYTFLLTLNNLQIEQVLITCFILGFYNLIYRLFQSIVSVKRDE